VPYAYQGQFVTPCIFRRTLDNKFSRCIVKEGEKEEEKGEEEDAGGIGRVWRVSLQFHQLLRFINDEPKPSGRR